MKSGQRSQWRQIAVTLLIALACTALPALAQEQGAPNPADSTAGTIFKWLNFVVVFGGIAHLMRKVGAPYFRQNAQSIGQSIRQAADERAQAQQQLNEVTQKLARIDSEIQGMRKEAASESASQAAQIRALAKSEVDRIGQAARAEIAANERAAAEELRAETARLAIQQASDLVRIRMVPTAEAGIFRSFVRELERSAT
jgi:F0F1-type ATP synthase membrane subunit b/b'